MILIIRHSQFGIIITSTVYRRRRGGERERERERKEIGVVRGTSFNGGTEHFPSLKFPSQCTLVLLVEAHLREVML
jgi:hypothetical protein